MSNSSLRPNVGHGATVNPGTLAIPAQAQADVNGNLVRTASAGDGTSYLGGSLTLIALASAARDTSSSPVTCSTAGITYGALDITVTSINGGASTPSITFFLERQGADGVWYQLFTTGAVTGALTISVDISPDLNAVYSAPPGSAQQHALFGASARLRWTFGGGTPPTNVTFSASLIGR